MATSNDLGNISTTTNNNSPGSSDDSIVLSLNERMINKDPRFKVTKKSNSEWLLTIDNVGPWDDEAYYICQATTLKSTAGSRSAQQQAPSQLMGPVSGGSHSFAGGARLNVLMPPKISESESSPSFIQVNEFDELVLRCKVTSEPQSMISWKREDNQPIDWAEQRFFHKIERKPSNRLISHDSVELRSNSTRRHWAGAYLVSIH